MRSVVVRLIFLSGQWKTFIGISYVILSTKPLCLRKLTVHIILYVLLYKLCCKLLVEQSKRASRNFTHRVEYDVQIVFVVCIWLFDSSSRRVHDCVHFNVTILHESLDFLPKFLRSCLKTVVENYSFWAAMVDAFRVPRREFIGPKIYGREFSPPFKSQNWGIQ